jgi:hypothetical protein
MRINNREQNEGRASRKKRTNNAKMQKIPPLQVSEKGLIRLFEAWMVNNVSIIRVEEKVDSTLKYSASDLSGILDDF